MLSCSRLGHAKLGVLAAMPVSDQDDLACLVVDVNHDVLDQGARQLLTSSCRHSRCVPRGIEILGKAAEVGPLGLRVGGLQAG